MIKVTILNAQKLAPQQMGAHAAQASAHGADIESAVRNQMADRLTEGLLQGIERCGSLLDEHGLDLGPGDEDELSDELRHEKR